MKRSAIIATIVAVIALAVWWPLGGQHWLAIHTGTLNEPGPYYGFFSGFGSDLGEYVLVAGIVSQLVLLFKHVNCHAPGCPRVGRYPLAGGQYKVCGHHSPDFKEHHPSLEHILEAHRRHKEAHRV